MPSKDKARKMIYLNLEADDKLEKLKKDLNTSNSAFIELLINSFYDFHGMKNKIEEVKKYKKEEKLTEDE